MATQTPKANQPRIFFIVCSFIIFVVWLAHILSSNQELAQEISYSDLKAAVVQPRSEQDRITEAIFQGEVLTGIRKDKSRVQAEVPIQNADLIKFLEENGVNIKVQKTDNDSLLKSLFVQIIPLVLIVVVFLLIMRSFQAGGGKAMSFGKSKAKMINEMNPKVRFSDIAGIDEAKWELQEIIDFLKEPKKFTRLGGRIPKGVLLVGHPGTGKTILAKGVAGEAGVHTAAPRSTFERGDIDEQA